MQYGIIYKIINKLNNKVYIGQTASSLGTRFKAHLKDAKNGSELYFHKAIRKYGQNNFEASIVYKAESKPDLNEKLEKIGDVIRRLNTSEEKKEIKNKRYKEITVKDFVVSYHIDSYYNKPRFSFYSKSKNKNVLKDIYYGFTSVKHKEALHEFVPSSFYSVTENEWEFADAEKSPIEELKEYGFENVVEVEEGFFGNKYIFDMLKRIVSGQEK